MKVIDEQLLTAISGAGGAPATPANTIGTSMIVGAISGIPSGPGGMIGGAVVAGSFAAIGMINSKGPVYPNRFWPLYWGKTVESKRWR